MHFDHGNPCRKNNIKGHALATTSAERDLGVIISPSMKQHEQVHAAVGLPQNLCVAKGILLGKKKADEMYAFRESLLYILKVCCVVLHFS